MSRLRHRALRGVNLLLAIGALLLPLVLASHHHADAGRPAPACAVCLVAQHAPVAASAPLEVAAPLLVAMALAPSVASAPSSRTRPRHVGRAPPALLASHAA